MRLHLPEMHSGNIKMDPDCLISPQLQEGEFLRSEEGRRSSAFVINPPYASHKLPNTYRCEATNLGVILWFTSGTLSAVDLFIPSPGAGWDSWSEDDELAKAAELEALLTRTYGAQRSFEWGTIRASFDARSGSSSITIRYSLGERGRS